MKVILTKDVKGLGRTHEEITASDGYALNYLIPNKFAVAATSAAKALAETRRKQTVDRAKLDEALLAQNIASLDTAQIVIKRKVNEKGHLYDAVGEAEIREVVQAQSRIELPESVIKLEKPIKETGTFDIPVASGEIFGKFKITVEAE